MNITATLITQIIVFLVLVWFTKQFVWPPIAAALDERIGKVKDSLAAANKAQQDVAAAKARIKQQLQEAGIANTQRLADAERMAQQMIEEAKAQASVESARIIAAAKEEAEQQMMEMRDSLREQVSVLAIKGAEQIMRKEVDSSVHTDLLSRLKAEL